MQETLLVLQGVCSESKVSTQPTAQSGTLESNFAVAATVAAKPRRVTGEHFMLEMFLSINAFRKSAGVWY
jgi:hypothetical protein